MPRALEIEIDLRRREQEGREIERRFPFGEVTIGKDDDGILAVPGDDLRLERSVDDLAEPRLGVLQLPGIPAAGERSAPTDAASCGGEPLKSSLCGGWLAKSLALPLCIERFEL
jgi:hypothetical protein